MGNFVLQGNAVVGVVIFLIIVLVQFLVINIFKLSSATARVTIIPVAVVEFGYSLIPLVDEASGGKMIDRIVIFRPGGSA